MKDLSNYFWSVILYGALAIVLLFAAGIYTGSENAVRLAVLAAAAAYVTQVLSTAFNASDATGPRLVLGLLATIAWVASACFAAAGFFAL